MSYRIGCLVLFASLLCTSPVLSARAQDTLSDSAWNADRARRAALRQKAQAQLEGAAKLVDTIIVRPGVIDLRVGDSIPSDLFYRRITAVGLTARGDTVPVFTKSLSISRGPVVQMVDGVLFARSVGTAEVRVGAGRRFNVDDVTRPISRIPIVVHERHK